MWEYHSTACAAHDQKVSGAAMLSRQASVYASLMPACSGSAQGRGQDDQRRIVLERFGDEALVAFHCDRGVVVAAFDRDDPAPPASASRAI